MTHDARIARLEAEIRRLRWFSFGALLIIGCTAITASSPEREVVEAQEFIVKDAEGKVHARLAIDSDASKGASLQIYDAQGNPTLTASSRVVSVGNVADRSEPRNTITPRGLILESGNADLWLANYSGDKMIVQVPGGTARIDGPSITLSDADGNVVFEAP